MTYRNLLIEKENSVEKIIINRPPVLNALNSEVIEELEEEFNILEKSPDVRVVIITGSGEKAFVAGADIGELKKLNTLEGENFASKGHRVLKKIENLPQIVIAAVNGFALGGGCELAMACDIRIASNKAKFGQPEVNLGLIPGFGGTQRLPRLVGKGRAMELIATGDMIDAEEAYRIGLVNKVVPPEELMNSVLKIAEKILEKSPSAVSLAKSAVHRGLQVSLDEGCAFEIEKFAVSCSTEDKEEGTTAFMEKRKPQFKGR